MHVDKKTGGYLLCGLLLVAACAPSSAKVSPEEAAQLGITGTPLTPLGAIRAGNAEGTIPEWSGGITKPPAGYAVGGWYVDPYADDRVLFTIDASNYQQYEDKLSPGNIALMKKYPATYKMHVYPARRSASYPEWFYAGTISNASSAEFCSADTERCMQPAAHSPGIAFPIPKTGGQVMWNHSFYFAGKHHVFTGYGFNAFADGTYATVTKIDRVLYPYMMPPEERPKHPYFTRFGGAAFCFGQEDVDPPRSAGQIFGGCNFYTNTDFDAYIYIPGQRRVRKAPEIGFYDSPGTGSDGLRTADQRFLFVMTGEKEWYDYSEPKRVELFQPYNSYQLASPEHDLDDMVRPGHFNQDLVRYELHRNWALEARLKKGFRHLGPHRMVWIDEDSWSAAESVMWDVKDEIWRVGEAFMINYYEVPVTHQWGDSQVDLLSGRYAGINGFYNHAAKRGGKPPDFLHPPDPAMFTPAGLRKAGVR